MLKFKTIVRCLSGMVLVASLFACSGDEDGMLQGSESIEPNDVSMDDDMDESSHFMVQYYDSILNSPEWKAGYDSWEQKLDVLQLPEQMLNGLPTEDLVIACVYYPMTLECLTCMDLSGINTVIPRFNGYAELKKRPDGVKCLIDYYEKLGRVLKADYSDDSYVNFNNRMRADLVEFLFASGYYDLNNKDIARIYNALRGYLEYYSNLSVNEVFTGYLFLMDICNQHGYEF